MRVVIPSRSVGRRSLRAGGLAGALSWRTGPYLQHRNNYNSSRLRARTRNKGVSSDRGGRRWRVRLLDSVPFPFPLVQRVLIRRRSTPVKAWSQGHIPPGSPRWNYHISLVAKRNHGKGGRRRSLSQSDVSSFFASAASSRGWEEWTRGVATSRIHEKGKSVLDRVRRPRANGPASTGAFSSRDPRGATSVASNHPVDS